MLLCDYSVAEFFKAVVVKAKFTAPSQISWIIHPSCKENEQNEWNNIWSQHGAHHLQEVDHFTTGVFPMTSKIIQH